MKTAFAILATLAATSAYAGVDLDIQPNTDVVTEQETVFVPGAEHDESTLRCSTNSFGTTSCYGSNGYSSRSSTNSFGTTTFNDNRGNTMRCSTNSFGTTTCY